MATLTIQTTPNAPRSTVVGWVEGRLKVKVEAPAVEGKANAELLHFMAEVLGVRPNAVRLLRGETARLKVIEVDGLKEAEVAQRTAESA